MNWHGFGPGMRRLVPYPPGEEGEAGVVKGMGFEL